MKAKRIFGTLALTVVGAIIGVAIYSLFEDKNDQNPQGLIKPGTEGVRFANLPEKFDAGIFDFTYAAENTVHAVVHVKNTKFQYQRSNPLYEWFYGERSRSSEPVPVTGFGSGVIISPDGYIVTNNHVIEGSDELEVVLNDRRTYSAELIGTDPSTDIALIRIKEKELPFIPYGDSDNLKLGEWVLAVGNPFNLTSTVTAGIVSAKGRNLGILPDQYRIEAFIQTDAALNRGNSGGALVTTNGELIGINTAIISPNGAYSGNSFAVPVNIVKKIVADLLEFGEVQRAVLGVTIVDLNAEMAEEIKIDEISGVYISGLTENGAAVNAGIVEGDVIVGINELEIKSVAELQEQLSRYRPNDKVTIIVKRGNKKKPYDVVLRNREGNVRLLPSVKLTDGARFLEADSDLKSKLGIDYGVQITELQAGKLEQAGIKEGFVITHINDREVRSVNQVKNILNQQKEGASLELEGVYPGGRYVYVYVVKY